MMNKELIEKVAQAIYHVSGGLDDEGYVKACGVARKVWKTDAPWDSNPDELCEHERDEYRVMARAAIHVILGED